MMSPTILELLLGQMVLCLEKMTRQLHGSYLLNVGERIASESENFLIAGANCSESHVAMFRYARKLVSDIAYVEKQNFSLLNSDCVLKFTFELVPADMKWAATFSGELSNAAFYFSPFGNVNDANKSTVGGSLGKDTNCTWKLWDYQSRLDVAKRVKAKKEELENSSYAESTKRNKLLNFIKSNSSRQEYEPILGQLVDKVVVPIVPITQWEQWVAAIA